MQIDIYKRLYNDIFGSIYPDLCFVKMIESGNIHDDIYSVEKHCNKYNAKYSFSNIRTSSDKSFYFTSYDQSSGLNLLDFINCVLHNDINNLAKPDRFTLQNLRNHLFEVDTIFIKDTTVDNMLIRSLKKYFHQLKNIEFSNCVIQSDCNFNVLNVPLTFSYCIIENIRSFSECCSNINLKQSSIQKIIPTVITSEKIEIFGNLSKGIDWKKMFLCCSFPKMLDLEIRTTCYPPFSFEDAFTFLPYSAPNLEHLLLYGKVSSLDFLTKFKNLVSIHILSTSNDIGLFSTFVTSSIERNKIIKRNKTQYEIQKMLYPNEKEEAIIGNLERERIYRLCSFLSTIDYSKEELKSYNESNNKFYFLNESNHLNIEDYYECYGNRLYHKVKENSFQDFFSDSLKYQLDGNVLYSKHGKIIIPKNFIYHINGKPIIFCGKLKQISTIEEAKQMVENSTFENTTLDELMYQEFINCLKNFDFNEITVGEMFDWISETTEYQIKGKEFLKFGEFGKKISYLFDTYHRKEQRLSDLKDKSTKCDKMITKIIQDNYQQLSLQEKIYLYYHKSDYAIGCDNDMHDFIKRWFFKQHHTLCENENEVLESLEEKTNGLYSKYAKQKQLFYYQYYHGDTSPYDIKINPEYIKKLDFSEKSI